MADIHDHRAGDSRGVTLHPPERLSPRKLFVAILPALCRLAVAMSPTHPRFETGCPVYTHLDLLLGQKVNTGDPLAQQQIIYLCNTLHDGLAIAADVHFLRGSRAVDFATGYLDAEHHFPGRFYPDPLPDLAQQTLMQRHARRMVGREQIATPSHNDDYLLGFLTRRRAVETLHAAADAEL